MKRFYIAPQRYAVGDHAPLTYGVFIEGCGEIEDLEDWQDPSPEIFVCYSKSEDGARRTIRELERSL